LNAVTLRSKLDTGKSPNVLLWARGDRVTSSVAVSMNVTPDVTVPTSHLNGVTREEVIARKDDKRLVVAVSVTYVGLRSGVELTRGA